MQISRASKGLGDKKGHEAPRRRAPYHAGDSERLAEDVNELVQLISTAGAAMGCGYWECFNHFLDVALEATIDAR